MKKNALIVSSLAALMALSTLAQAFDGYGHGYRHAEFRYERREPAAYRYERHWQPERVVIRSAAPAPDCVAPAPARCFVPERVITRSVVPAPARYVVEEPRYQAAPLSIGLRLHGLRVGLNL